MRRDTRRFICWLRQRGVPRTIRRWMGLLFSVLRNVAAAVFMQLQRRPFFTSATVISVLAGLIIKACWPIVGGALFPILVAIGVLLGLTQEFSQSFRPNRWEPYE